MRRPKKVESANFLAEERLAAMHDMVSNDVRRASPLRKISLPRLEARDSDPSGRGSSRSTKRCWSWPA